MTFQEQISNDLIGAIKAKNDVRISCLRMLKTALKNRQVEKRGELTDEEAQSVVSSLIRRGQEAAKEFRQGGREELALKEEEEGKILYGYLPEQLDAAEIENTHRRIALYETTLIPQARMALESVIGAYATNRSNSVAVLLAQQTLLDLQIDLARTAADHQVAWAALESQVGREVKRLNGTEKKGNSR